VTFPNDWELSEFSVTVIYGTLFAAMLVIVFLASRSDMNLSVGQSIGMTLGVPAVIVLLILWDQGWFWWVWIWLDWLATLVQWFVTLVEKLVRPSP
jgi:hypothetical protein